LFYFSRLDLSRIINSNEYWLIIKAGIISILEKNAPLRTKVVRPEKTVPWYDNDVLYLARKRNKLYFIAIKSKNKSDWTDFTKIRAEFKKLIRSKRASHYQQFIRENSVSNAKLWNFIDPLINPNKKSQIIPATLLPDWINVTAQDVANCFSNFFDSALAKFSFKSTIDCISFIEQHFSNDALPKNSNGLSFGFAEFTESEVLKAFNNSKESSSPGFVGIESKIMKYCCPTISYVFTKLFNHILLTSEIPLDWKISHITPIYKNKGSKTALDNYRPISVISPIAKIFESLLAVRIRYYFEENNLFFASQFGFRQNQSCEHAINTLFELLIDAREEHKYSIAVLLDLSKAFDTLDHELLLAKLSLYNFSDNSCKLLKNYLSNRFSITCSNGATSDKKLFKVGVPQGSILGPLLFIIFLNDICSLNLHSKLIIFADDTTVVHSESNIKTLIEHVTNDLSLINNWLKNNKLILNVAKTQSMLFNRVQGQYKNTGDNQDLMLKMDNTSISFVQSVKLLGCTITNTLSLEQHTIDICNKVRSKTFLLKKCAYLFSKEFNATLFKVFIQSRFDYCSSLLLHFPNKIDSDRLERCFNRSIKTLLKLNLKNETLKKQKELLDHLRILPLKLRIFQHFTVYLFSLIKQNNMSILTKKIFSYKKTKIINNLRKKKLFVLPLFKTNLKEFSFCILSVKLLYLFLLEHLDKSIQNFKNYFYLHVLELYIISLNLFSKRSIFY
jgi:hypothetical protein